MQRTARLAAAAFAIAGLLLGLALVAGPAHPRTAQAAQTDSGAERVLSLTGSASTNLRPDTAEVRLVVRTDAPQAKDAVAANGRVLSAVTARLRDLGVKDEDVRTAGWNLLPQYDYGDQPTGKPPQLVGYQVQSTLAVRTPGVDQVGDLVDAAVAAGANGVEGVSYFVKDPSAVDDQLLQRAVQAARGKADLMARLLGVRVIGVRRASVEGPVLGGPVPAEAAVTRPGAATFLPPGTSEVTRTVQVDFMLGDQ